MGNRFILARSIRQASYSEQRITLRLNEGDFEPRHMCAYGYDAGKFAYRQMFEEKQSRPGNRQVKRSAKKAARQQGRRWLKEQQQEGECV